MYEDHSSVSGVMKGFYGSRGLWSNGLVARDRRQLIKPTSLPVFQKNGFQIFLNCNAETGSIPSLRAVHENQKCYFTPLGRNEA